MSNAFTVVCVSPQPWDAELPTNRQQMMRRVARFGHEVVFVETSHFVGRDLWRVARGRSGAASLLGRFVGGESVEDRITVRKAPWLAPRARRARWANRLNVELTRLLVRRIVRRSPNPVVLWLYDAASGNLVGRCGTAASVYDCVDDHVEVSGKDRRIRELLAAADREAARRASVVITTTRTLYARHRANNPRTYLVPNVGDYEHFAPAASRSYAADELRSLPRPVLGFTGNITAWKVDFELLLEVVTRRPEWTLVLVGPVRADAEAPLAELTACSNVRYLGPKSYERVPAYVAGFDVGLCPYRWNDAMRSGFPLKLYEYLAAGKPVVASGNPDVAGMEPDVRVIHGAAEFQAAVDDVLALDSETDRRRRTERAAASTWESRARAILDLVDPFIPA